MNEELNPASDPGAAPARPETPEVAAADHDPAPADDAAAQDPVASEMDAGVSATESPAAGSPADESPAAGSPVTEEESVAEAAAGSDAASEHAEAEVASDETPAEPAPTEAADAESSVEDDDDEEEVDDPNAPAAEPLELIEETPEAVDTAKDWYILKVQVNREKSICDALKRRVKIEGLESHFGEILVPTEDVREFTKSGKQRIVKRKLYPGYIVVNMAINDDTWFVVRETPGIGDFTGAAGKPSPLEKREIDRILRASNMIEATEEEGESIKTAIKFKQGDRVRVKEGYFQNFEGDIDAIDESNGRITVMINIFGRATPVELDHWQVEDV